MQIIFGADHGGYELKEELKRMASEIPDMSVEDLGAHHHDPTDDYPEYGFAAAQRVVSDTNAPEEEPTAWGVLSCRSGSGMAIAANRVPGVRAVVCRTLEDIDHARRHNNANILVLEGDHITPDTAWRFVQTFVSTPFDGGRHTQRVIALG